MASIYFKKNFYLIITIIEVIIDSILNGNNPFFIDKFILEHK